MLKRLTRACASLAIGAALIGALAACGSAGLKPTITPQQAVAIVCPPLLTAIDQGKLVLATLPAGDPRVDQIYTGMSKATPIIAKTCAAGATVSIANIQDFSTTVLPALSSVASALPLTAQQQKQAQAVILSAEVTVGMALAIQANVQATATTPSTTTPSTTPATTLPAAPAGASAPAVTTGSVTLSPLQSKPFTL